MLKLFKNTCFMWGISLLVALPLIMGACSSSSAATENKPAVTTNDTNNQNASGNQTTPAESQTKDNASSVQIELTYDELMNQKQITKEVEVNLPGSLIITLSSNPSTGYQWEAAKIGNSAIIAEDSHQFVEPQSDLVGAPGKDVWTFKTLEKGTSTINFQYSRPWEGGENGEWTVNLTVVVK